ncbi:MAG: hypothetical protein RI907_2103 [Pseudomonadota bacterium]|jgi:uncharacterized membrane protein YoaK (UPF0700 family)
MPVQYLRTLTAPERNRRANVHLGLWLAFVAGATNAGGFLAVKEYTSHMTGVVSSMADTLALGQVLAAIDWFMSLVAFVAGAATSAILINWGRQKGARQVFALPLLLEAVLLLIFGVMGAMHQLIGSSMGVTVSLLCFVMGLQNAMVTKVSHAEIRTTHVTGLVTDIGIELGKVLYWNQGHLPAERKVVANLDRLRVHTSLVVAFFVGGLLGALGFKHVGYVATVPLALVLALMASPQFLPARPPQGLRT